MQYQSFGDQVARTTKKVVKAIVIVIVLMAIAFLCLAYWGVYDEGVRAGTVNLHYVARYAAFPWRGDTKYFITKVERVGQEP